MRQVDRAAPVAAAALIPHAAGNLAPLEGSAPRLYQGLKARRWPTSYGAESSQMRHPRSMAYHGGEAWQAGP